jgi:S-formylglutathione hydrolase
MQEGQLKPEDLEAANKGGQLDLELRMQGGYDHSYFFIATFVEDHLRMHAKAMGV